MTKGSETRDNIVNHALTQATKLGLDGLTIGNLAAELNLSKSGLFAHFRSKEELQIQVLSAAARRFTQIVVEPSAATPPGVARIRAVFENWLHWGRVNFHNGGCIFVAAAIELDDRPGPVRDHLVGIQKEWVGFLSELARAATSAGEFRKTFDAERFAQEFYGIMLSCHHFARLLHDRNAEAKARAAFESLLEASAKPKTRKTR